MENDGLLIGAAIWFIGDYCAEIRNERWKTSSG
jgi:hypothetical protein